MTTLTIDTHAVVKRLTKAGAGEELAEAIAISLSETGGDLATKTDLKAGLAELEVRLTNRFYGVAAGLAALILAGHGIVIAALFRFFSP